MAELYLKGLKVKHRMDVAKSLSPSFILGMDFLMVNQACMNYALKPPMFTLFDGSIKLPFYTCCDENNCVTLACTVCVPAYNEVYVQVDTPQRYNNQEVILEQPPCALSVSIAQALAFCKNNKAVCCVLNTNPYVVTLKRGLKLANTIASMQLCQPPSCNSTMTNSGRPPLSGATSSSSNSSVQRNKTLQLPLSNRGMNGVTDVGMARARVTDRDMANTARAVN